MFFASTYSFKIIKIASLHWIKWITELHAIRVESILIHVWILNILAKEILQPTCFWILLYFNFYLAQIVCSFFVSHIFNVENATSILFSFFKSNTASCLVTKYKWSGIKYLNIQIFKIKYLEHDRDENHRGWKAQSAVFGNDEKWEYFVGAMEGRRQTTSRIQWKFIRVKISCAWIKLNF